MRRLLDEAFLNGRGFNASASTFLMEIDQGITNIEKAKKDPNIPITMVGIIQSGDKPNRNLRYYPWSTLKKECERYAEELVPDQSFGELDHPEDSATPSLQKACHTIEDIWFDNNKKDVWAKIQLLNPYAPVGDPSLKARSLVLNNKAIGISSRALGSLTEGEGYDLVEDDLEMICWDLVGNASNYGSERMKVQEGVQTPRGKKLLTEAQCFGDNCRIGEVRQKVEESAIEQLTEEEKVYLNILGVKKFLEAKRRYYFTK